MEENLEQQLAGIVHEPLLQLILDVQKAYDSLYRGICTEIRRRYGLGPKLQRLLQRYWDGQKVVQKIIIFLARPLKLESGVTQGNPVSLTIFNIVVNAVVREVLLEVCGPQEAEHWFIWASGEHNI